MKKFIIITLFFIWGQIVFGQSGWQSPNASPIGGEYNDIFFIDNYTGWIVGNSGLIMKTEEGGAYWNVKEINGSYNLNSVYFVNVLTGVAVGTKGKILRTTNGGDSWVSISSVSNQDLNGVIFWDEMNGLICGDTANVLKTTNGGLNWTLLFSGSTNLKTMNKLPNNTVVIFSQNQQLRTTDMGQTWTNGPTPIGFVNHVNFLDNQNAWAPSGYYFYKSTNGGVNWTELGNGAGYWITPYSSSFINSQTGYAVGTFSFIGNTYLMKTTNSGSNWEYINIHNENINLKFINFINSSTGFCIGELGSIFKTTNAGENWIPYFSLNTSKSFYNVQFLNSLTGYARNYPNEVLKSTDGGNTWNVNIPLGSSNIYSLSFADVNTGWASGPQGALYKTTNGGQNWLTLNFGINSDFNYIYFINQQTGWAMVNTSGVLYKTTNGGENWFQGYQNATSKLQFLNASTGFMAGTFNTYITIDGGISFQAITPSIPLMISNSVSFINPQTGWVCNSNQVFKTTNRGSNWTTIELSSFGIKLFMPEIKFINSLTGFCYDVQGKIIKSIDGGTTWNYENILSKRNFYSLYFINEMTGWLGGTNGVLFKTTTGGTSGVKQVSTNIPDNFSLFQNYPNPFNPSTKINYEIKSSGFVSLKVYDLLGKEVATLVNEKQNAGSYAMDFNSTEFNLPSGIYFYTLKTDGFTETKKMVLVK
ncbi:MAG: T9SS type A sorting domain-containing protein [Bacteroidetes bacterium]|nr:T9SS type A sorting domain-containing protein [Bacteroidota bacterium]